LVLGVYMGLAFLNSPRGFLGTDTGGKVATFEVMTASGRFDPDVGYWAERWDPDGRLHPLAYTSHTSSRKWVNVTTLPALWVGWQLYRVGGYRASLLVPMAGSLAAAFAGLALLRRLGVRSDGWAWAGFGVLALASPLTIYALDFWEHSVGVALMAWAVVLLCDVVSGAVSAWWWRVLVAGVLFGVAATMRTESLVYFGIAGIVLVLQLARFGSGSPRRRGLAALGAGGLMLASAALPVVANEVVEQQVVGDSVRSSRIVGTALSAGDRPDDRLEEALTTLIGVEGSAQGIALGAGFVALAGFAFLRRDAAASMVAVVGAGGMGALRAVSSGFGFVPGVLPAWGAPAVAGVAATLPRVRFEGDGPSRAMSTDRQTATLVWAIALGAVPLVLVTQFRGGAGPQWGGRYLLLSGLLLAVLGLSAWRSRPLVLRAAVVALALALTGFGVAWLQIRSHEVDRTIGALEARPEPVLVSDVFHLAREGGATYGAKRWLTLIDGRTDAPRAAALLTDAGIGSFAVIEPATAPRDRLDFPGFAPTTRTTIRLFDGVDLRVTSWRTDSS
jgi:hypothetical protein